MWLHLEWNESMMWIVLMMNNFFDIFIIESNKSSTWNVNYEEYLYDKNSKIYSNMFHCNCQWFFSTWQQSHNLRIISFFISMIITWKCLNVFINYSINCYKPYNIFFRMKNILYLRTQQKFQIISIFIPMVITWKCLNIFINSIHFYKLIHFF